MVEVKLIWPSYLHHFCLATENLTTMVKWYQSVMGMSPQVLSDGLIWLSGAHRNILLTEGASGEVRFVAFSLKDKKHLKSLK